jgi:uncharacterized membrane protein YgcG
MSALRVVQVLLSLLVLLISAAASAQERIRDYRVEVQVQADGAIDVVEHITVRAEGQQIRRGIYRDFPTRYRDRFGNAVVVELEVLELKRDGQPEPWFTEPMSNGLRINTGGDAFLPGLPRDFRFSLRYRTTRQLGFFAEHDELYWNAIGTGWAFQIESAQVQVRLPADVAAADLQLDGYTGPQGAQGRAFRSEVVSPGLVHWTLTQPLQAGEGLTIVLGFPKGLVTEPTRSQRLGWLLADNRGLLVALAALVLLLVFCAVRWHAVGRDPAAGVIFARYEPPAGRSAAELRYLRRMSYDTRCLTADLLAGAVAGAVEVERSEGLLFGERWQIGRLPGVAAEQLHLTQAALLGSLLPTPGARIELTKSKQTAQQMQAAMAAHLKVLHKRLHGSHFHANLGSAGLAALIAVLGGVLAFASSGGHAEAAIIAVCVLMAVVVFVFAWLVKAPTAEGRKLLDEIEGLRLYLSVAERDELAAVRGPGEVPQLDAARYEALLPYAIALDVEEAWSSKFTLAVGAAAAAAATGAITWYRGGGFNDIGSLAKAVGSGLNSSIASSSSPPGSSSGGGGGGSSGGGGGGGGGGGR